MRAFTLAALAACLLAPRAQVLAQALPTRSVAAASHDVVVVVDCSFPGADPVQKLLLAQWVVSDVLDAIPGGVAASLIVCGREAADATSAIEVVRPLGALEWTDKAALRRYMTRLRPGQVAGVPGGLRAAHGMLAARSGSQKLLVVVSDGDEIGTAAAQAELARLAREDRAQLHLIGLSEDAHSRAAAVGQYATVYSVQSSRDLDAAVQGVSRVLARMSEPRTMRIAQVALAQANGGPEEVSPPGGTNGMIDPRSPYHRDALIQKLTAELLQYKQSADMLARDKAEAEATMKEQTRQINELAAELRVALSESEKKDLRIQQLTAQLASSQPHAAQAGALQATIGKQAEDLRTLDALLTKKDHDLLVLSAKLAETEKENKELRKAKDEAEGKVKTLSEQVERLVAQLRDINLQFGKLQKALEEVTKQRDAALVMVQERDKELARLKAELKHVSELLLESERKFGAIGQSEVAVRASAAAMSSEMGALARELHVVKGELDKRDVQVQQLTEELAALRHKAQDMAKKLGDYEQRGLPHVATILNGQVETLRGDLEKRDGLVLKLNMDLAAERQRVYEMTMCTKEIQHRGAMLENQLQASQFEIRELKEKILHLLESKHEKDSQLHMVQCTLQAKELELVSLRKELEASAQQICVVKELGTKDMLLEGARRDAMAQKGTGTQVNLAVGEGAYSLGGSSTSSELPGKVVIPHLPPGVSPPHIGIGRPHHVVPSHGTNGVPTIKVVPPAKSDASLPSPEEVSPSDKPPRLNFRIN